MPGLLFILAHPDDETFIAGGTIAKYAAEGVPVALVCGTRGERGSTGDLCSIEELPKVREGELREAARILGIGEVEFLPYEDQKLRMAPRDEIRKLIVAAVRRHRPEIVITFDPHGANEHTDHIAISRFAMDAVPAAADARWYPDAGAAHTVDRLLWQAPVHAFELGAMAEVRNEPGVDYLIDIGPWREKKHAAMQAHGTQYAGLSKAFGKPGGLIWEAFRVAWGPRPGSVPAGDLFGE